MVAGKAMKAASNSNSSKADQSLVWASVADQQNKLAAWVAEVCIDERFGGAPTHMIQADWRAGRSPVSP